MVDVFTVYAELWHRAEKLGATVRYDGLEEDGAGSFHPDPFERGEPCPTITVGRSHYEEIDRPSRDRNASGREKLPPPDLLHETITLAHECGHFLSWKERTPRDEWDAYFSAAKARDEAWCKVPHEGSVGEYNNRLRGAAQTALTSEQMQRIIAEEVRAWTIGHEMLEDLGFEDFACYAERERKGLHFHRYRLGIEDLWEDEVS